MAEVTAGEAVPEMVFVMPKVVIVKTMERMTEKAVAEAAVSAAAAMRHRPARHSGGQQQSGNEGERFSNRHRAQRGAGLGGRGLSLFGRANSTVLAINRHA